MFWSDFLPVGGLPEKEEMTSFHLQQSYSKIAELKSALSPLRKSICPISTEKKREKIHFSTPVSK
jgi:hypothetical protein